MILSELYKSLENKDSISFTLPNGDQVPAHFHLTEVGLINKHFVDCGGVERIEKKISLQLWVAQDYDHRLKAEKIVKILDMSKERLGLGDLEVEVEYQGETIGRYGLADSENGFKLVAVKTACLAQEACGVPESTMVDLSDMAAPSACTPGGGCC